MKWAIWASLAESGRMEERLALTQSVAARRGQQPAMATTRKDLPDMAGKQNEFKQKVFY